MTELFRRLLDDAALFPPARTPVEHAVPAHEEHRAAWYADLVGPFVTSASTLPAVADAARRTGSAPLEIALVVRGGAADVATAVEAARWDDALALAAVELACDPADLPAVLGVINGELPPTVRTYVELPADARAELDTLTACGHRMKLRTGGTVASAFPSPATVAGLVVACAERSLPLKCTAGLHHAVAHTDPDTGFAHHGFLNVLAAVGAAADGAGADAVAELLALRDPAAVLALVGALDVPAVRRAFDSFGTCSVTEPVDDLVALGLLAKP